MPRVGIDSDGRACLQDTIERATVRLMLQGGSQAPPHTSTEAKEGKAPEPGHPGAGAWRPVGTCGRHQKPLASPVPHLLHEVEGTTYDTVGGAASGHADRSRRARSDTRQ